MIASYLFHRLLQGGQKMSELEIYQLPKDQIYWTKQELEDKIFALSKRL